MATQSLSGIDMVLKVGTVIIGCAQKIDVAVKTATSSAACRASGGWEEHVAGRHSWTAGTDGLVRIATGTDAALNVTATNLLALQIARTVVSLTFGSPIVGDQLLTGNAVITDWKVSAGIDGAATFTVSFQGTGPLTPTVNV